jgi:hypothetical protein
MWQMGFIQTLPIEEKQGFANPIDAQSFDAFVNNFTDATLSFPGAKVRTGRGSEFNCRNAEIIDRQHNRSVVQFSKPNTRSMTNVESH